MLNTASLPSGTGNAQIVPAAAGKTIYLRGWAASEDTGTGPARLQIFDAPGGNLLVPITLIAGGSIREFCPPEDAAQGGLVVATGGLYVLRVAGTSTVLVYTATV